MDVRRGVEICNIFFLLLSIGILLRGCYFLCLFLFSLLLQLITAFLVSLNKLRFTNSWLY